MRLNNEKRLSENVSELITLRRGYGYFKQDMVCCVT